MSAISDYYTAGARSAGGYFGAPRDGGRKHRGQDFSHSTRPGTIAVPALLGGTVVSKTAPSSTHGFGYGITIRSLFGGEWYRVSYSHGPWASQQAIGQGVSQGQVILHEGNTGATSGSCVHVEVYRESNGTFIDPWPFIQSVLGGGSSAGGGVKPNGYSYVVELEQAWMNHARGEKLVVDGVLGANTIAAIKRYQEYLRGWGYKGNIDGDWGAGTQAAHAAFYNAVQAQANAGRPTIRRGSKGQDVIDLQRRLKTNYSLYAGGLNVDGDFGPATEAAVKEFQRRAGLAVDGVVGSKTWGALGF